MSVEVAGTWEFGWSAPKTEFDLWWGVMCSYGIPLLHMTPCSGFQHKMLMEHNGWDEMMFRTWTDVELTPVFVHEEADTELADFEHPENALYVFGRANFHAFSVYGQDHKAVRIDCPKLGMLWPHQALAIVMDHRLRP